MGRAAVHHQLTVALTVHRITDHAQLQIGTAGLGAWQVDGQGLDRTDEREAGRAIAAGRFRAAFHADPRGKQDEVQPVEFALLGFGRDRLQIHRPGF
ncbi:hypothetical protein D3C84_926270 [compost metagenome]